MSDLRPYVCTSRECDRATESFPSLKDYLIHEIEAHEICLSERSSARIVKRKREESIVCIFCGERTEAGNGVNARGRHIGRHMEEMAFTVVPKAYEDWDFYTDSSATTSSSSNQSEGVLRCGLMDLEQCVKQLINAGAPLEAKDSKGYTALSLASSEGHSRAVELLLQAGAKTDYRDERFDRGSPLILAATYGHTESVKLLLGAGALLEAVDSEGFTALQAASCLDHIETVKLLLKAGARPNSKSSLDGPLQYSAQLGHVDCTRLLLDAGASIEEKNSKGFAALMVASRNGRGEIVELLLGAGAKVDDQNEGFNSLMCAACYGHRDVIEMLLAAGANIEARGQYGRTVLFHVMNEHTDECDRYPCSFCSGRETRKDIIEHLCKKGADVSAIGDDGYSLLNILPSCDHIHHVEKKAIKKVLQRFGAK